jgi:hypothetical protein
MGNIWAFLTELLKRESWRSPRNNSWARKSAAVFGSMMITTFGIPLFLMICLPETFIAVLDYIKSAAVTGGIAAAVLVFCFIYPVGVSIALGLIASASIGDEATQYHLMMRGIKITFIALIAIGGALLLATAIYHQIVRTRNDGLLPWKR